MEICINIRRRSGTIREILQKQKNQGRSISHIWNKKKREMWKIKKLREKNVENSKFGKKMSKIQNLEKSSPIRMALSLEPVKPAIVIHTDWPTYPVEGWNGGK